jgi:glycerol-3-phosphate acyltransferase PlsY
VALGRPVAIVAAILVLAVIVLGRHAENISRLVRGEERTVS